MSNDEAHVRQNLTGSTDLNMTKHVREAFALEQYKIIMSIEQLQFPPTTNLYTHDCFCLNEVGNIGIIVNSPTLIPQARSIP